MIGKLRLPDYPSYLKAPCLYKYKLCSKPQAKISLRLTVGVPSPRNCIRSCAFSDFIPTFVREKENRWHEVSRN